jgi:Tc5 transposase DNA-binding domain
MIPPLLHPQLLSQHHYHSYRPLAPTIDMPRPLKATCNDLLIKYPSTPDLEGLSRKEIISLALAAQEESGVNKDGSAKVSYSEAAILYGIMASTLQDHVKGSKPCKEAHAQQQTLTPAQEDVLVAWAITLSRRGTPLSSATIHIYASKIAGGVHIGQYWVDCFLKRHLQVRKKWTQSLEACRAKQLNPMVVDEYFKELSSIITEFNIHCDNIYNMDEKGVQLGVGKRIAAIADRSLATVNKVEEGNREMVTIIKTTCADGTSLKPSAIFQGTKMNLEWSRNNPGKFRYTSLFTILSSLYPSPFVCLLS